MKIETAHTILIGSAIAFFLLYALFETGRWWKGAGAGSLAMAAGGLAAAVLFAVYLRRFLRRIER